MWTLIKISNINIRTDSTVKNNTKDNKGHFPWEKGQSVRRKQQSWPLFTLNSKLQNTLEQKPDETARRDKHSRTGRFQPCSLNSPESKEAEYQWEHSCQQCYQPTGPHQQHRPLQPTTAEHILIKRTWSTHRGKPAMDLTHS